MQGTIVNGYTLQRLLGSGGMAEVWYAQNEIGKPAAVKILNDNLSNNAQIVERFHNEALIMVKLSHPNIRQVYSYGYIGNRHCIIQEYLEGTDLESLLKSGRHFTDEELQRWWNQTADALNYTHSMGIVHRDIKPSNLFLDKYGNIKLLDFGIAKVRESISMTRTGAVMGTLMYMSPEQVKDSKYIDHRTDIYSLAVSFVHLLSGKAPYDIDTSGDYEVRKGIVEQPLDLSGVPAAWRGFLTPYLNKEPDQRPALRHFEEVQPVAEQVKQPVVPVVEEATRGVETPQPESKPIPKPQPKPVEPETQPSELSEKPKSKTGLWVALGLVAVAAVLLVLLLKPKKEEPIPVIDYDTEAYQACYYVNDYRTYIAEYGRNAHHYSEAKQFVDNYVADSIAEAEARAKAEAEAQAEAERIKKQEEENQRIQLQNTIKDEYINLLSTNRLGGLEEGYFLFDIDKNGIPELWIKSGDLDDYKLLIYSYIDGIRKIGETDVWHTDSFSKGNGYIIICAGGQGYYFFDKLAYNGHSITRERVLETEYDFDDYTPMSEFWEYFDITDIPVDVLKQ